MKLTNIISMVAILLSLLAMYFNYMMFRADSVEPEEEVFRLDPNYGAVVFYFNQEQ